MQYIYMLIRPQESNIDDIVVGIYENEDDAIKGFYKDLEHHYECYRHDELFEWMKDQGYETKHLKSYRDVDYGTLAIYFEEYDQIIQRPLIPSSKDTSNDDDVSEVEGETIYLYKQNRFKGLKPDFCDGCKAKGCENCGCKKCFNCFLR
jgi:hypothetical protein